MPKDVRYAVKRGRKYLVDIHPNERYNPYSVAPTMGNRHMPCEACTEWGDEPVYFEPYTLCSNLKVLAEEYRWDSKAPSDIKIIHKVISTYKGGR